ncbi:hypothetical protein ACWET9_24730 [Streptomyces sp. NPDC004059]
MALCRTCRTVIPCHCHLTPPAEETAVTINDQLDDDRLTEIAESHPGPDWYGGEWRIEYVEGTAISPAIYRVKHAESGEVLAELPDFAGPIALFIADAHDAIPALVAEVRRLRAELAAESSEAHPTMHRWMAEIYDPTADEWVPGTRHILRPNAVKQLNHAKAIGPTWKDGTPVERRLVRETTTYTVESPDADTAPAARSAAV